MVGGQPEKTTQINKVELPGWVDEASRDNYAKAQQIAAKPFQPYTGDMVADFDPTTLEAFEFFKNTMGTGNQQFNEASDLFSKAGKGITALDRDQYMNPFIDLVETKALGALEKARVQALMSNADKAIAAKAFGGDRAAIVDAITNSETAEKAGILSAGLRKEAFDTASGLMQSDIGNMLAGGEGLISAGGALSQQRLKDFQGLLGIGAAKQDQVQRELDAARSEWDRMQNHDLEQLNILNSTLGQSPYGKTENIQKETTGGGGGMDIASLGMGLLSLLFFLSDEDEKKDKTLVDADPITGIPIYEYRYKGQKKGSKKIRGPMAQDVEMIFPDAVKTIGGKKHVRGDVLGALARV